MRQSDQKFSNDVAAGGLTCRIIEVGSGTTGSAEQADSRTLLRRLYFDLIGLPPVLKNEDSEWTEETLGALSAQPNCLLKQHINCMLVPSNGEMSIGLDSMYHRCRESFGQSGLIAIDQHNSVCVGRLKIGAPVKIQPEAINTDEGVNADIARFE